MREIVLDTETTGLDPSSGHRVVEIGAVEISNLIPTGRYFHRYLNPERDMPEDAFRVHGLSYEFLSQHKVFREIAAEFLDFIEDVPLVIHNAEFDTRFLNAEFALMNMPPLAGARIVDTLAWRVGATLAAPILSTPCASATRLISRGATSMARCSTPIFSRKSMPSFAAGGRRRCRFRPSTPCASPQQAACCAAGWSLSRRD